MRSFLTVLALSLVLGMPPAVGHAASARDSVGTRAKDGWPDTPAGAMARRWVRAFGKGEKAMAACLAENLAPDALAQRGIPTRLETYRQMHERLGDLMLVRVTKSDSIHLVASLATSELTEREFTFEVQPQPPHKLVKVSFQDMQGHGHGGGFSH